MTVMKKMRGEEGKKGEKRNKKRGGNDRQETGIGCEKNQGTAFTLRGSTTQEWRHLRAKGLPERAN